MTQGAGGKLGEHLSRILAETIVHATAATADHKAEHTRRHIDGWLEEAEVTYRPLIAGVVSGLVDNDETPQAWRDLFAQMGDPEHQFDVLLQIIGFIGAAISGLFVLGPIELQQIKNKLYADYQDVPLSPADLADMVERNIVGQDWAEGEAAKSGISANLFDLMVKDTGEPYGVDQALSLLRRGIIDVSRFTEILYYSRIRNEFLPDVLALAHDTMTQGDAVTGALKGVLDHGTAGDLFARAGGLPEQFETLLEIAGNPIGVEAANVLFNHGLISDAELTQVILHSRINPQFEPMAKLLRFRYLSAFQIVNAVKAGSATAQQGIDWLIAEGYPTDQVTAVVHGAAVGKVQAHKDITEAQIATMYEAGAISKPDAEQRLEHLGYAAGEVDFILSIYDERRHLTMIQGAINQVRKVFLARRIDDTTASNLLDKLGVDPGARDTYITVWQVEQASELRELTAPQIGAMLKKGLFTDDQAVTRWEEMGYSAEDAALLLGNYGGPPPPGSPAAQAGG